MAIEWKKILTEVDIIDEDDMASDSDTKVPTQQSVKAYVDNLHIFSSTVTLANTRLSLVNGTAFFDPSISSPIIILLGCKLVIIDSAGKKAVGYIKAQGEGETYGPEILDAWTNNGYETFTVDGTDIDQAVETGTVGRCYDNTPTLVGGLFKYAIGAYTKSSGSNPYLIIGSPTNVLSSSIYPIAGGSDLINGLSAATTKYVTQYAGAFFGIRAFAAVDFTATGISVKQVLTPSPTGVTITSTAGGTTYNWASIEAGFNYNDASGYTYKIVLDR